MHITYRGDYALKTILELALHYGEEPAATIPALADQLDIPTKFLEQILLDLKRGGFVESRRGKIGGYLLAKAPSQIRVGDIVRFIDGSIEPVACVDPHYKGCREIKDCIFRGIWKKISEATAQIIDRITFEDLVKEIKERKGVFTYSI
jgi:Rrf2 family protein